MSVDNPAAAVAGWRSVAATPPVAGRGGGDCGGTKHLQKKFLKKIKNELNKQVKLCKNVNSTNNGVNE